MSLNADRITAAVPVWKRVVIAGGALSLAAVAGFWQPHPVAAQAAPGSVEYYNTKVKPIFEANCFKCHGGENHRGGLTIDTMAGLLKGGHDGPVIVVGHPEQSLLIKLIRHEGPANDPMPMPPKGDKLSDADIATVAAWIQAGAKMP
jgi:mono/diheme cytochrome c family protein